LYLLISRYFLYHFTGQIQVAIIGKSLTHKRLAFHNYKKKIPTSENARLIDHTTESTDRYIKDGTRVEKLYMSGYSEWEISFFTGILDSYGNILISEI